MCANIANIAIYMCANIANIAKYTLLNIHSGSRNNYYSLSPNGL